MSVGESGPVGTSGHEAFGDAPLMDASGLKAYAHPLRLQMIRYLNDHGPATATQLARHLGESTGQTSYHLRQLERHGLVEDDPGRGKGRERWWRSRSFQVDATQLAGDPVLGPAAQAVLSSVAHSRTEALDRWLGMATTAPAQWREASLHSQTTLHLTPDEARELDDELLAVLERYTERSRRRANGPVGAVEEAPDRPAEAEAEADTGTGTRTGTDAPAGPGAERVRVYVDVFPLWEERA
jgi:DNA-binding transcriptional ArsR family regulator